jgi:hypothetical protein
MQLDHLPGKYHDEILDMLANIDRRVVADSDKFNRPIIA